jgi:excisionase family DNA binding protein
VRLVGADQISSKESARTDAKMSLKTGDRLIMNSHSTTLTVAREEARNTTMSSMILTVPEVCEYLHISQVTVYRMLRRKDIPAFRIGKSWRFSLEHLERWIEKESLPGEPGKLHKP